MEKIIYLSLPRIYFDTNVLIDATLNKIRNLGAKEQKNKDDATKLWTTWNGQPIRISPFVIGEFISKGGTPDYNKSTEDMLNILYGNILPKCEIVNAKIGRDSALLQKLNWIEKFSLAKVEIEAEVDINGKPAGRQKIGRLLDVNLTSWNYNSTKESKIHFTKIYSFNYEAPYFETVLFKTASDIAIQKNLHLADAMHLVYATREEVDIIVSSDEKFLKYGESIKSPEIEVKSPGQIIKEYNI